MNSNAPVVVTIAVIAMGALLWIVSALRMSGEVPPEQAEALAEEAERECVLEGHPPDACPKMVGRHQRDCLDEADRVDGGEGARVDDKSYMSCMREAFGEPDDGGNEDAATDTGTGDTGATGDAADVVGDVDATSEETN